jgi:poly(ADP-ribose) glycohydrolase ARH3
MNTNTHCFTEKLMGAMVGSAVGDAIGKITLIRMDDARLRAYVDLAGYLAYTDDTAMAIGLAESLANNGKLIPQKIGEQLRYNYQREPWREYRYGPPTVFSLVEKAGLSYPAAAARLRGGAGLTDCGAATRIAPVATFFAQAPDLYAQVALSASVTHTHPVAIDGAAVLAKAIALVMAQQPNTPFAWQTWMEELIAFSQTHALQKQLRMTKQLFAAKLDPKFAVDYLGCGSAVQESLPFAFYAFLWHPTTFEQCVLCAVTHGVERSELGAMAGAIAGAYHGIGAVPQGWRAKLDNEEYIEHLAHELAQTAATANGKAPDFATQWMGKGN